MCIAPRNSGWLPSQAVCVGRKKSYPTHKIVPLNRLWVCVFGGMIFFRLHRFDSNCAIEKTSYPQNHTPLPPHLDTSSLAHLDDRPQIVCGGVNFQGTIFFLPTHDYTYPCDGQTLSGYGMHTTHTPIYRAVWGSLLLVVGLVPSRYVSYRNKGKFIRYFYFLPVLASLALQIL
jgi:hypothetical protein